MTWSNLGSNPKLSHWDRLNAKIALAYFRESLIKGHRNVYRVQVDEPCALLSNGNRLVLWSPIRRPRLHQCGRGYFLQYNSYLVCSQHSNYVLTKRLKVLSMIICLPNFRRIQPLDKSYLRQFLFTLTQIHFKFAF